MTLYIHWGEPTYYLGLNPSLFLSLSLSPSIVFSQAIYLDFERLDKIGFNPFPDPNDPTKHLAQPTPGNEWEVFYQAAQRLAPVMLFCLSRRWNASQWCHQELDRYKKLHGVGRPALIEDACGNFDIWTIPHVFLGGGPSSYTTTRAPWHVM